MTEGRKEMPLLLSPEVCVVDAGSTNSQISGSDSLRNWTDSILTALERCSIVLLYSGTVYRDLVVMFAYIFKQEADYKEDIFSLF